MPLPVTNYGDNAFQPGVIAEAYIPDQLIAGDLKLVTSSVTIGQVGPLVRGTVMGMVTATGVYVAALSAAADGSQVPAAILVDSVDTTTGPMVGGVYLMGEFNSAAVTFGTGITLAAAKSALQTQNIYLKTPVTANDPS